MADATQDPGVTTTTSPATPRRGRKLVRKIVVAGDATVGWNIARIHKLPEDSGVVWTIDSKGEIAAQAAGAALNYELLRRLAMQPDPEYTTKVIEHEPFKMPDDHNHPEYHHSFVLWKQFPRDRIPRDGRKPVPVWRIEEFIGVHRASAKKPAPPANRNKKSDDANLVVIADSNLDFRDQPGRWPGAIDADKQPLVLLCNIRPVGEGPLWRHLIAHHKDRMVVVVALDELRKCQVAISRELSWERIAGDVFEGLQKHPEARGLLDCAFLVVSLPTGGAIVLSRDEASDGRPTNSTCHAVFDPRAIETSWIEDYDGKMIGFATCLTAALARVLARVDGTPKVDDIITGVKAGLSAGRKLHLIGFQNMLAKDVDRAQIGFPIEEMAATLFPPSETASPVAKPVDSDIEWETSTDRFFTARIEVPVVESWSILESVYPDGLKPVAEAVARLGVDEALEGIPIGRFGKFVTVDRGEIEGYRSIRALMREYNQEPEPRPLNIAVFGPPGSGKSFGVRAVAESALDKSTIERLTFNLSQMRDPSELVEALQRVRDAGLRGKLPFVLWDEFDSPLEKPYGWLRYFLAPMQDGAFQGQQILHPLGKAIFVFAGGTEPTLAAFKAAVSAEEFVLAKGPDFVSRLKGHVDVVGPDPRNESHRPDLYFGLRRAILLRSMIEENRPNLIDKQGGRLGIDPGVLRGFLEVGSYRHAARSLESIISMSALVNHVRYERSALPAKVQLNAHVDADDFIRIADRYVPHGPVLTRLANAVHMIRKEDLNGARNPEVLPYAVNHPLLPLLGGVDRHDTPAPEYLELPEVERVERFMEQNRGIAREIPALVEALGYELRDAPDGGGEAVELSAADPLVQAFASHRHDAWYLARRNSGWKQGARYDKGSRLNPHLRPWDRLTPDEQREDCLRVDVLPRVAKKAKMKLVRRARP